MKFADEFFKFVSDAKNIVITSHTSPDDDSVGSVLAIYWTIKNKYPKKSVEAIYSGERENRYKKFEGYDKIKFVPDLADNMNGVDLLIMLDGGGFGRFSNQPEKLRKFAGKTICIDHHSSPPDEFDLFILYPKLLSSCQIIYESFYKTADIPKPIAEALLLGLLGDTGNFSYLGPSDLGAFDMGKRLIDILQIQVQEFVARYSLISPRIFKLISELIVNTKLEKVEGWDGYSWTHLRRELIEREFYSDNEISEAAYIYMNCFLRVIEGAPWGFVITPKSDGGCSVSLRSLPGSVNVRKVVEDMKTGGGHDRAAGSTFKPQGNEKVDPIFCYEKIKDWMSKNNQSAS